MGRPEGKNLQILDLHRLASLALFVSVIVGAYASKAKCKAIWNRTFSVGGVA